MLQNETAKRNNETPLGAAANQNPMNGQNKKTPDSSGHAAVPKGLQPLPHQVEAFEWTLKYFGPSHAIYLALDAGLGKTIVAAMLANHFRKSTFFYVCPPFMTGNTRVEFNKWCFNKARKLYLIPDSMIKIQKDKAGRVIWKSPVLESFHKSVIAAHKEAPPVLIVDEAHRFKNLTSQRTQALMTSIVPFFKGQVIYLSGTPLPNSRPKELWSILNYSARNIFGPEFFPYGLKYCGGYKADFGWNFEGFTNRKEFKARLSKSFMLRMKKSEVLNLPPKLEGLLTVGEGIPPIVSAVEKKILEQYSPEDLVKAEITKVSGKASLHLATYLRLLGEYKLKWSLPYIKSLLEETNESLLIFAVHKATIDTLQKELADYLPIVITGKVLKGKRLGLVKEFQTNPKRRVFIGNIAACGVGFTLTKASRVLFVEFSWVDGENSQASDRAHRIGQTRSVQVQYIVLKDSFDRKRMEVLLKKRQLSI